MLLSLAKIIDQPGATVPFSTSLDLRDLEFGGSFPVTEPVLASGEVRNTAGVLQLTATAQTTLHGICDRCASNFERAVSFPVEAVLVTEIANDNGEEDLWTFLLKGNDADLDDIITTAFVLGMDSKLLCKDNCKGLCCRCGKNLNDGPCDCQPEIDPRFAVLQQLLKDKK